MRRKLLKVLVRVLITAGFLALVLSSVNLGEVRAELAHVDWVRAAAFASLIVLVVLEMGLRWWLLMRAAGIPATLPGALAVAYTGMFFNQFSIGAAGGDIARAVLVARDTDLKARAVGTILLDRVIGLATLIVMGCVVALAHWSDPAYRPFAKVLGAMVGALGLGALVYFNAMLRQSAPGRWLMKKLPAALRDMDAVFTETLRRPGLLAICVLITMVGQGTSIVAIWGLAHSMGFGSVTVGQCFALMPVIFVVMALPISIGGFGVGEKAFMEAFVRMGLQESQALGLAVLYRVALFAVSLPGIVIFLLGKARTRKAT